MKHEIAFWACITNANIFSVNGSLFWVFWIALGLVVWWSQRKEEAA